MSQRFFSEFLPGLHSEVFLRCWSWDISQSFFSEFTPDIYHILSLFPFYIFSGVASGISAGAIADIYHGVLLSFLPELLPGFFT